MKLANTLMLTSMLVSSIVAGPALAQESPYPYCSLLQVPSPDAPAQPGATPAAAPASAPAPATPAATPTSTPAPGATPAAAPATGAAPASTDAEKAAADKAAADKAAAEKAAADKAIPNIVDLIKKNIGAKGIVDQILAAAAPASPEELESQYNDVYNTIVRTYIEPANLTKVNLPSYKNKYKGKLKTWGDLSAAIKDVVGAVGDRWTWYQDPVTNLSRQLGHDKSVDWGASLRLMNDGSFTVEHLEPGSTAQAGGLREGDTVISINNVDLKGMTKEDAEKLGVKSDGDQLHVKSVQDGQVVEVDYTLHAAPDDAEAPKADIISSNIVYLKLPSFMDQKVFAKLISTLIEMDVKVPGGVQGIILDLRYNGGGRVDMAKTLIATLANQGVVLHERSRDDRFLKDETTTLMPMPSIMAGNYNGPQLAVFNDLKSLPLVILINGSSASASEIVTGALKESRPDTTVMGERSFGKFVEMSVRPLPTCGTMAVTSAMYTTPNGEWLHGVGIEPNVVVHQTRGSKDDTQLAAAVKFLQDKTSGNGANVAKMAFGDTRILGTVAEKPLEPRVSTWQQWWEVNQRYAMIGGFGLLFLLIGVGYFFVSRPEKED